MRHALWVSFLVAGSTLGCAAVGRGEPQASSCDVSLPDRGANPPRNASHRASLVLSRRCAGWAAADGFRRVRIDVEGTVDLRELADAVAESDASLTDDPIGLAVSGDVPWSTVRPALRDLQARGAYAVEVRDRDGTVVPAAVATLGASGAINPTLHPRQCLAATVTLASDGALVAATTNDSVNGGRFAGLDAPVSPQSQPRPFSGFCPPLPRVDGQALDLSSVNPAVGAAFASRPPCDFGVVTAEGDQPWANVVDALGQMRRGRVFLDTVTPTWLCHH